MTAFLWPAPPREKTAAGTSSPKIHVDILQNLVRITSFQKRLETTRHFMSIRVIAWPPFLNVFAVQLLCS